MKVIYKKSFVIFTLFFLLLFLRFPDIRNEMKYLVIAEEMIQNKSIWLLSYFGNLYPDKPPLYFWLLSSLELLFGKNWAYPLALLLGSFLPMLGIVFLCIQQLKVWKPELKERFLHYVITTPYFMGVAIFLRMDMLMSFFITLALSIFCFLYHRPEKISAFYLVGFYTSIFLGVFSKGGLGFLFPLLIILSFLFLEKNLKFLGKLKLQYGFVLILTFVLIWFSCVYFQKDGKEYLNLMLGQQTLGRAVQSSSHARPFYYYFLHIVVSFFPFGFLYFVGIFYSLFHWKDRIHWTSFEKWAFAWAVPGIFLLSIFSGKLDIYMLPLFPGAFFFSMVLEDSWDFRNHLLKKVLIKTQDIIFFLSFLFLIALPVYNHYYSIKPILGSLQENNISKISFWESPDLQNIKYYLPNLVFSEYDKKDSRQEKQMILLKKKYLSEISPPYDERFRNKEYVLVEK